MQSEQDNSFYITTPIYYVNDIPHLGTAYCTIAADVLARFERMVGKDVHFLTGTDEHGEKIQEAAEKREMAPQDFTDEVSQVFRTTWHNMGISFDDFIRTTEPRHKKAVTYFIRKAMDSGDIYLGQYEGWYCVPDETFWTEGQLVNGKCPTCGRVVKKIQEENYFFKLTKYVERLKKHIELHPNFILPESKKNEVLGFLNTEDIRDISVSRTSFSWGIPFPPNPATGQKHVVYVWFDALINYVSALNPPLEEGSSEQKENFDKIWGTQQTPRALHLVGKDILRFHAVYWPCFLMSVGLPLPKGIFAHGWWTIEGQKMSKSLGNAIDPVTFTNQFGHDAFRLFLFREFPFGQDGDFSLKNFKERINADLANNLGNLVSRTLNLVEKNMGGRIFDGPLNSDTEMKSIASDIAHHTERFLDPEELMERFEYHRVLGEIFQDLNSVNKYLEVKAPWTLAKDPAKKAEMAQVLNGAAEVIRITALKLWPFIPRTSEEILRRLGQPSPQEVSGAQLKQALSWGSGRPTQVTMGQPLFMRLP